jgi:hypothetical protein
LVALLFACRRSEINGSIMLDGEEFDVEECRVGQLVIGQQSTRPAHRFLLLDDGDGRQLHLSDEDQSKLSAYYVSAPGKAPVLIGSDCGTLTMQGDPTQSPTTVRGTIDVSCTAGAHKLNGKLDYSRCKAWNVLKSGR